MAEKARLICIEWTVDQASTTTWGDQISLSPGNVISISSVQQSVSGSVDRERDTVFSIRGSTQTAFVHLDLIRYIVSSRNLWHPRLSLWWIDLLEPRAQQLSHFGSYCGCSFVADQGQWRTPSCTAMMTENSKEIECYSRIPSTFWTGRWQGLDWNRRLESTPLLRTRLSSSSSPLGYYIALKWDIITRGFLLLSVECGTERQKVVVQASKGTASPQRAKREYYTHFWDTIGICQEVEREKWDPQRVPVKYSILTHSLFWCWFLCREECSRRGRAVNWNPYQTCAVCVSRGFCVRERHFYCPPIVLFFSRKCWRINCRNNNKILLRLMAGNNITSGNVKRAISFSGSDTREELATYRY